MVLFCSGGSRILRREGSFDEKSACKVRENFLPLATPTNQKVMKNETKVEGKVKGQC